jgi:hypothetical protein
MQKHLPPAPAGWEISGTAPGGKRKIRCTKHNTHGNQCVHEIRYTSTPPLHQCIFQKLQEANQTQLQIERWATSTLDQRIQFEVAALVAITDAPLEIVENPVFHQILGTFVEIGRSEPQIHIGSEGCKLTRGHTRSILVEYSRKIHEETITHFSQMPCVSLTIDAGTIERRHFLDIMVLAPYSRVKPFLYAAVENSTLTADDYGRIVMEAIQELYNKGVHVRSIVGDNLPAQIVALARWSPRSCLKQGEESYLHGIKYSPCMCHFIQLVVGDLITRGGLCNIEEILQEMIAIINCSEVRSNIRTRCPQSVKTRWLSRFEALTWLLSREHALIKINIKLLPKTRRQQFQHIITKSNFAALTIYRKIVFPFNQAIKFFEKNDVTLCHVYPALKTLKKYFIEEYHIHINSEPEYAQCCANVLPFIQQRQHILLDRDLLKAAFWLTSFGCRSLSENSLFIPSRYLLDVKYRAAFTLPLIQDSNNVGWGRPGADNFLDDPKHCAADYSYTGEVIREDELEEVPKTRFDINQVLIFLKELLSNYILEDNDMDTQETDSFIIHQQVEESLQFFFCNPESIAKCRNFGGSIETEVELWNWMKYTSQGRISNQVALKAISIVSIPASEASCERSLSRQKRIMHHLRANSNEDLLRARFLFETSNH